MSSLGTVIQIIWGLYSLVALSEGLRQVVGKNNPYGICKKFHFIGAFVYVDAVIFGIFFILVSAVTLFFHDFVLFLLAISVFWTIRSIGEQMYWFMEQFAVHHKNPEHTLWFSKFFKRNSSWIAMQIYWQCISVIAIISTVYLFKIWLQ